MRWTIRFYSYFVASSVLSFTSSATTIVTLITTHGIVICADGKSGNATNGIAPHTSRINQSSKVFLIQNRFVVGHAGIRDLSLGIQENGRSTPIKTPYSTDSIIQSAKSVAPMFTLHKVAEILREELARQFTGFDDLVRTGVFTRKLIPETNVITEFTITGYESGAAKMYAIGIGIDWGKGAYTVPPVRVLCPSDRRNLNFSISGYSDASQEVFNPKTQTALVRSAKFKKAHPAEYDAFVNDHDLSIAQMTALARALVLLEIENRPDAVGFPLTFYWLPKDGAITTKKYQR